MELRRRPAAAHDLGYGRARDQRRHVSRLRSDECRRREALTACGVYPAQGVTARLAAAFAYPAQLALTHLFFEALPLAHGVRAASGIVERARNILRSGGDQVAPLRIHSAK